MLSILLILWNMRQLNQNQAPLSETEATFFKEVHDSFGRIMLVAMLIALPILLILMFSWRV